MNPANMTPGQIFDAFMASQKQPGAGGLGKTMSIPAMTQPADQVVREVPRAVYVGALEPTRCFSLPAAMSSPTKNMRRPPPIGLARSDW